MVAWRWYSNIWIAILFGQFLIHDKVYLLLIWYPKKFRLKIKLILSLARFYICLDKFWTWESKNDLDVQHSKLHKYTEDMSLPRVVLEWKAQVFFHAKKSNQSYCAWVGYWKKEHRIFVVVGLISNDIWQEFLLLLLCKTRLPDILKLGWFISIWVSRKSKSKSIFKTFRC